MSHIYKIFLQNVNIEKNKPSVTLLYELSCTIVLQMRTPGCVCVMEGAFTAVIAISIFFNCLKISFWHHIH